MYYQGEVEKNDRRKIITVATAIVVVVLILIIAIIVVATKKSSGDNIAVTENGSFNIEEKKEEPTEQPKEEPKEETPAVVIPAKPTTDTSNEVPVTGPEDALPMALAFGSLATVGTAYLMSRKETRLAKIAK